MKKNKICVFSTALVLFLSGCTTVGVDKKSSIEYSNEYGYFVKDLKKDIGYDDVILTMEEKGVNQISQLGNDCILDISNIPVNVDLTWIDMLDINESSLLDNNVTNNVRKHRYRKYYNKKTNDIIWNKLIDVIYDNSIKKEESTDYIVLTKDEIKIVLLQMDEFTDYVVSKYTEFDMEELACKLQGVSFVYYNKNEEFDALAACSSDTIYWSLNDDGTKPDLNEFKDISIHEFKHFFCYECIDEREYNIGLNSFITAGGVSNKNNNGINLRFLEESLAEDLSANYSSREKISYYNQDIVLNTLRYILSLQLDYDSENMIKYQLLHNPVAFFQQFPVMDNNKKDYLNNIKALSCLNELLTQTDKYDIKLNDLVTEEKNKDLIKRDAYQNLYTYSLSELDRMFFTNLVLLNETNDVSLDYNLYLIKLYSYQIEKTTMAVNTTGLYRMDYDEHFNKCLKTFIDYYSIKKEMATSFINSYIDSYIFKKQNEYPEYVSDDVITLHDYLYDEQYDIVGFSEIATEYCKSIRRKPIE